jgi:hypothetical protein
MDRACWLPLHRHEKLPSKGGHIGGNLADQGAAV